MIKLGILENGGTEPAKQERVRARPELAEFNKASKVLGRQAKQCAMEAGLRKHAASTGRLSSGNPVTSTDNTRLPLYINASAVQAQVIAAAPEFGQSKIQPAVERAEDPTDESSDASDSDSSIKVRRSTKKW